MSESTQTKRFKKQSAPGNKSKKRLKKTDDFEAFPDSSNDDPFSDIDFSALDEGVSEDDFWAKKLGLTGEGKDRNRAKLAEEYAKDGLGDDFLELFDFMDEVKIPKDETTVNADVSGKYVPPHKRASKTGTSGAVVGVSRKETSFLGLLNRVSEGNLDSISRDIIVLLNKNILEATVVAESLVAMACDNPHITVTLQGTFSGIVCAISVETSPSNLYSGSLLTVLVKRIREAVRDQPRTVTNLIRFTSTLFSLGLFSVGVIEALLRFIVSESIDASNEQKAEWVLTCLRFSGRVMRDLHKQKMAILIGFAESQLQADGGKKLQFALKELVSMKEGKSNFRAIDHLQTISEWLTVRSSTSKKFKATDGSTLHGWRVPKEVESVQLVLPSTAKSIFDDDYSFPGSWSNSKASIKEEMGSSNAGPTLEELAASNRMTTEAKKNAFIAIMGAIDSKHAMMRLDEYGVLNPKNCSSIVAVVVHCALQEKKINQFYLDLTRILCTEQREHKLNRKFSISFKIEFSKLITGGKLSQDEIALLSNLIAFYIQISGGTVTMQDILKPQD